MNILFFITDISGVGGTERITISLANELAKKGYNVGIVSLISNKQPFYTLNSNVKIYHIFKTKSSLYLNYFLIVSKLRKIIKTAKAHVIIDVVTTMSLFSIPATIGLVTKVITWEHFNIHINLGKNAMTLGRFMATKFSDAIVTLTPGDENEYTLRFAPKSMLITIPNFLHPFVPQKIDYRRKVAIAVGRLTYQKGFDLMIPIWADFVKKPQFSDWKLFIVGQGEDEHKLKQLIAHHNLTQHAEILPPTTKIEQYYHNASLFLMTSRWEGLPMVLLESQAHGLPAVAYDCKTGPSAVIKQNHNGILVPFGNPNLYLEALCNLASNTETLERFGKNAVLVSSDYYPEKIIPIWINLFNKLTS